MKKILLSLFLFSSVFTFAQINWVVATGGLEQDRIAATVIDPTGFMYVVGDYSMTVDFDPGPEEDLHTAVLDPQNPISIPDPDIFIQKFDLDGNYIWGKSIGGKSYDLAKDIKIDANGNVYIAGYFMDSVDFDPGPGTHYEVDGGGQFHNPNYFILKLTPNGQFIWVKVFKNHEIGGWDGWTPGKLELADNSIYFAGYFEDTLDVNPDPIIEESIVGINSDILLVNMDFDGNLNWYRKVGGDGRDGLVDMTMDDAQNIILTGWFNDVVDFDPGLNVHELVSMGESDGYVLKLNTNGDFVWVNQFQNTGYAGGYTIETNGSDIVVFGYAEDSVDIDPTGLENWLVAPIGFTDVAYIMKMDASGNVMWSVNQYSQELSSIVSDMAFDEWGNVHLVGGFVGEVDFDADTPSGLETSVGYADPFYIVYDETGLLIHLDIAGSDSDTTEMWYGTVNFDEQGGIYMTGGFTPRASFNTSTGLQEFTAESHEEYGLADYFLFKRSSPLVGLEDVGMHKNLVVYPNPIADRLYLHEGENNIKGGYILDVSGKRVLSFDEAKNGVNVSSLITGIYTFVIKSDRGLLKAKIIKD